MATTTRQSFFSATNPALHEPRNGFTAAMASTIPGIQVLSGAKDVFDAPARTMGLGNDFTS